MVSRQWQQQHMQPINKPLYRKQNSPHFPQIKPQKGFIPFGKMYISQRDHLLDDLIDADFSPDGAAKLGNKKSNIYCREDETSTLYTLGLKKSTLTDKYQE